MSRVQWVKCKMGYHTPDPDFISPKGNRACIHCGRGIPPKPDRQEQRRVEMIAKQKEWLTNPWDQ